MSSVYVYRPGPKDVADCGDDEANDPIVCQYVVTWRYYGTRSQSGAQNVYDVQGKVYERFGVQEWWKHLSSINDPKLTADLEKYAVTIKKGYKHADCTFEWSEGSFKTMCEYNHDGNTVSTTYELITTGVG